MAVVILGEGARSDQVRFSVSPLAELGAALHVLTAIDHDGDQWAATTWARLPSSLQAECRLFSPCWGGYRARLLYPATLDLAGDVDAELAALSVQPAGQVVEQVGYALCMADRRDLAEPHVDDATRRWLAQHARGRDAGDTAELLLADPNAFRDRLVALLRACWDTFFAAEWDRVAPRLRTDVAARQALADRHGLLRSLEALTPVASLRHRPDRLHLDKMHQGTVNLARTSLLVVPTIFGRPHLLVKHERGWPAVLQYPVPVDGGATPIPQEILRRRLQVLADPTKVRLCRVLARHTRSTRELADWADMAPPDIARHLRALREAGLVTTRRSGRFVYYTLDHTAVRELGFHALDVLLR